MKVNNRIIESIRKEYVAFDGEVFCSEKECLKYEAEQKFNLNKVKLPIEDIFYPLNYWYNLTYIFTYDSFIATPGEYLTAINNISKSKDETLIAIGDEKNIQVINSITNTPISCTSKHRIFFTFQNICLIYLLTMNKHSFIICSRTNV